MNNIPSGEYLLGMNVHGLKSSLPYDTRFYPGVTNPLSAAAVKIAGAKTIEGLDFPIGERKATRSIVAAVKWPDGRPVINARVVCKGRSANPQAPIDSISRNVDSKGEATCEVLAEKVFKVEVTRLTWSESSRPVRPVATRPKLFVPTGTSIVRLSFVIDPKMT